jgi:hypothetical protein
LNRERFTHPGHEVSRSVIARLNGSAGLYVTSFVELRVLCG